MEYYYDPKGKPISRDEWATRFEDYDQRVVALTNLEGGVKVSTVWLGLDYSVGDGPPLIFETVVFGGPLNGEMMRYSTRAQAIEGHAKMLKQVMEADNPKRWGRPS